VSVIVPFLGSHGELEAARRRLDRLELRDGDEILIADNRPDARAARLPGPMRIVPAAGPRSPAHARNVAAREARGDWLVLVDADVTPAPDLVDAYLAEPPPADVAILVGTIAGVADPDTVVSRYATLRGFIGQERNVEHPYMPWGQTANLALRRSAFEAVGGFAEGIRAAEDADLCFRLQRAGHRLEPRPAARAEHHHRHSAGALLSQQLVHAAGLAWLDRRYPGAAPAMGPEELVRRSGHYAVAALRAPDREVRRFALLDLAVTLAFELGRMRSNAARA
jgi:glycosyltransferase involved in cell wall biosynthesis